MTDDQTNSPGADFAPAQETQTPQPEQNGPADVLRDGNIKATIWKNERENGPSYNTTFARTWQDESGAFRDSHSFSGTELLRVSELARGAYARTNELRHEHMQQPDKVRDLEEESLRAPDLESFKAKRAELMQELTGRSPTPSRRKQ